MPKKVISFAIKLAFMASLFIVIFRPETFGFSEDLFQDITLGKLLDVFREMELSTTVFWLSFAVIVKLAGIFAGVIRWRLLLAGQGISIPFWYLTKSWFMGRAIGLFLPGTLGLDGYRLVDSAAHTGETIKCATVIAVEKLIGFIALGLLVFLTLPLGMRFLEFNLVLLAGVLVVLFCFILTCFLILLNPRIVQIIVAAVPTPRLIRDKVNMLGTAITAYSGQRGLLMLAVFFGFCVHLGICFMYFGVAMALRAENTSVLDILFCSPLVIVGSVIGPTVSGAGIREIFFGFLLAEKAGAAAAVLVGHLGLWIGEVVPFAMSLPLLLFTTRPERKELMDDAAAVREATTHQGGGGLDLSPEVVRSYRIKFVGCILAGLLGGLVGGGLLGMTEALWHINTLESFSELNAYWWGPTAYGIAFTGLGLGVAAGLTFFYLLFNRFAPAWVTFALSLGGTVGVVALVFGRFRYQRDILDEHAFALNDNLMVLGGAAGIALAAVLVGGLAAWLLNKWPAMSVVSGVAAYIAIVLLGVSMSVSGLPQSRTATFSPPSRSEGPNVILITVDTLRADFLEVYNPDARPKTPNITAFAQDTVLFQRGFAQSSWTKASFGTIFSGMYPEAHTATGKASALPDEVRTIAEVLQRGGYYTKGFSNNPNINSVFNYDQGFVDYVDLRPDYYFGAQSSSSKLVLYDILRKVVQKAMAMAGGRIRITDFYQPAEVVTGRGLGWIDSEERPSDAPFFLFLHYMDPHDPFRDPERPGKGYARVQMPNPDPEKFHEAMVRSYSYEIEYMDTHVGRFLDGLKERGLYDESIIVFTADHGEEFYEHGGWWHGLSLYDEQIAVPLLIKLPGNRLAGKQNPNLARLVDLAPTISKLVGLRAPSLWQGKPLFATDFAPGNADIDQVYAHLDFEGIQLRALRTLDKKLIRANEGNKRNYAPIELYDLKTDPGEQINLADSAEMAEAIEKFSQTIRDMQGYILESRQEPVVSDENLKKMQEDLDSLGYL